MKERIQIATKHSKDGNVRPQLTDPIDLLIGDHSEGFRYLQILQEAVQSIQTNGFSAQAFQKITDSTLFVGTKMRQHNLKEERYLFPKLDKHVFEFPNAIRHERREMWQVFNELTMSVKDVEEGRIHGTTIRELIHSASMVVERFRNQIEKENTIIFPMVKRLFTPDEYASLTKEISLAL
jgi:hemerythrin-like domain-containing protein